MTIDELNALAALTAADEVPVWDSEESSEPTKKITAQNFAAAIKTLASLLGTGDVVNDLTSTSTTAPLSAAQGKALNDYIVSQSVNTGITGVSAYKAGNVVTLIIQMGTTSIATSTGWFSLGTLPESLKPPISINFLGYENRDGYTNIERVFQVSARGVLYVSLSNGENCQPRATVTYSV